MSMFAQCSGAHAEIGFAFFFGVEVVEGSFKRGSIGKAVFINASLSSSDSKAGKNASRTQSHHELLHQCGRDRVSETGCKFRDKVRETIKFSEDSRSSFAIEAVES